MDISNIESENRVVVIIEIAVFRYCFLYLDLILHSYLKVHSALGIHAVSSILSRVRKFADALVY